MEITFIIIFLLSLFYFLGKSADLVIYNVRVIAEKLGIKIFFLGLLLGAFTSLPELAVGINSVINNVSSIAVGNLTGGIIVLFTIILGTGIILNRKVVASEKLTSIILVFIYLILPFFFGLNGYFGLAEGLTLVVLYFLLLIYLYYQQKHHISFGGHVIIKNEKLLKNIFLIILGLVLIVIISNIIIRLTSILLTQWKISSFATGLVLFSLGTNLPEIIVMIRSWHRNIRELSISNLIGSAMANTLILGFLIIIRPMFVTIDASYYILFSFIFVIFTIIAIFYHTDKHLSRIEGWVLVFLYLLFISSELTFILLINK